MFNSIIFSLLLLLPPRILNYNCSPANCVLLCCSDKDECVTFSSPCLRSACSSSKCKTKCCVDGRCGTDAECSGYNQTANVLVWSVLAVICSIICVMMCIYFVYEKLLRKRKRVNMDEAELENGIEMSPEVIES